MKKQNREAVPHRYYLGSNVGTMAILLALAPGLASAAPGESYSEPKGYALRGVAEMGFLAPLAHTVQFGKDGTDFDYVNQGAQDNLYFTGRLSLELDIAKRHTLILVYQPLELKTRETLEEDIRVDGMDFVQGTPMVFTYGFPFYRLSYLYDFADDPNVDLAIGGSLQIRNATIDFASADGELLRSNRNIGPVPELKFRARYVWDNGFWLGTEVDGMYAPVSYLNGDNNGVVGAILDASLRAGLLLDERSEVWLNLRYLGGGAEGTDDDDMRGDGYTSNWLHFMTTTVGFTYKIF